ncbi:hypothetical protein [Yersinia sp. 1652 StPb PI]|uniref:hypothetical protein n=1 Tax=Yersinia sp. 1652 StPb PI TaxID=3061649 RepID=UPI00355C2019
MENLYVQFSNETETVIISWFCCQQSPEYYSFLGEVYANDPRYIAFYDSLPSFIRDGLPEPIVTVE